MTFYTSRITGTGSAFPKKILTNHELAQNLGKLGHETNNEWIVERTGIHERRISDLKDESEHNSSLAAAAAKRALEMAGKKAEDIDQIIFATCSPDTTVPAAACWLQTKLGAKNAFVMDLNAACSGFVYAVTVADQFIKTGHSKTVLAVGSEVLSSFVDWEDRTSCILFGDGAGAAIIERVPANSESRIISSHLKADGSLWELFVLPGGGSSMPLTPELCEKRVHKMKMKGKEIFKVAVKTLADFAEEALRANNMSLEQLDWFIPHQANMRIIEATAKRLGCPMEKVLVNLDRYGNTSAATVPTVLDEAVRAGKIKKGQTILMDVFGAGLTYGSVLMRW